MGRNKKKREETKKNWKIVEEMGRNRIIWETTRGENRKHLGRNSRNPETTGRIGKKQEGTVRTGKKQEEKGIIGKKREKMERIFFKEIKVTGRSG